MRSVGCHLVGSVYTFVLNACEHAGGHLLALQGLLAHLGSQPCLALLFLGSRLLARSVGFLELAQEGGVLALKGLAQPRMALRVLITCLGSRCFGLCFLYRRDKGIAL